MRPIQHADYEQPDGTLLQNGMWLEVPAEVGVGRRKFSGVMTRELGQVGYLQRFRSFSSPQPTRLAIALTKGRASSLDVAVIVDGPLRRQARYPVMPSVGDFVAYSQPTSHRSDVYDQLNFADPHQWEIGQVIWCGTGRKLSDLGANLLVRDAGRHAASSLWPGSEEVVHLSRIRIRGTTADLVRDRRDHFAAQTYAAQASYYAAQRALFRLLEPLYKEAIPQ